MNEPISEQAAADFFASLPGSVKAGILEALRASDAAYEVLNLKTNVALTVRGEDGQVKDSRAVHNES